MDVEKIIYLPFGNNLVIGNHIKKQLSFLKKKIPSDFQKKILYDLGCGDGKITLKLKDIFKADRVYGCDSNASLVWRAKRRGIKAQVLDLEKEVPKGELAILWGVLHHLKNKKEVLEKIKSNFQYLVLRELLKVNEKKSFWELGEPFFPKEINQLLGETLKNFKKYEDQNSIFVFWKKNYE